MNRSLVTSLILSMLTGLGAAVAAVAMGWGWLAALAAYSGIGCVSLLGIVLVIAARAERPAPAAAPARPVEKPADKGAFA